MTKHTPGPWYADEEQSVIDGIVIPFVHVDGKKIAEVNTIANARLIAAAPELLEALERLILICEAYNGLEAKKSRAIVAKARGEA